MRWLRFEMKGMVDVQFIFIGRGLKKIMPAALTFCIPKRVLITYSCSKQRSEAWSCPSLNSSIYRELHSHGLLAWFEFSFCRLDSEKYWFYFYFLFFYFFCLIWLSKMSSGNEEWRLWSWLKISMTNILIFKIGSLLNVTHLGVCLTIQFRTSIFYITF